jgi:hypothetical protein
LELLREAGLIWSEFKEMQSVVTDAELARGASEYMGWHRNRDGYRLTWAGHEFYEAARNQTIYNRAKEVILEKGGSLPFVVLNELLISLVKNAVGLK